MLKGDALNPESIAAALKAALSFHDSPTKSSKTLHDLLNSNKINYANQYNYVQSYKSGDLNYKNHRLGNLSRNKKSNKDTFKEFDDVFSSIVEKNQRTKKSN